VNDETGNLFAAPKRRPAARGAPSRAADDAIACYVSVALHRGIDRAGGEDSLANPATFTYGIGAGQLGERAPSELRGHLVRVPLGRGNTPATGIVTEVGGLELAGEFGPARIKRVLEVMPSKLSAPLLDLAMWMSAYYIAPLGMVLAGMLPAAVKRAAGTKVVQRVSLAPDAGAMLMPGKLSAAQARALGSAMKVESELWPMTPRALAAIAGVTTGMIAKLAAAGALSMSESLGVFARTAVRQMASDANGQHLVRHALNAQQQEAVEMASAPLATESRAGGFGVTLIRGVTGSGKTEVYLAALERLFAQDGTATGLVLVPEIALTPQTSGRFLARFGAESVAVLHSGLTATQRASEWSRVALGKVRLVVGARSAVFSPLVNLRMIIVDEEHDGSYKQDSLPRYHARDVAIKRASLERCAVVLGSATPSLESWHNCIRPAPLYALAELTVRATGAAMPDVQVVDLRDERRLRAAQGDKGDRTLHLIGPTLEREMHRALGTGGQVMLLLNRRGFANYICCPDVRCGFVLQCDHCDATMVYHRQGVLRGNIRCHHCRMERLLPKACPLCHKHLNTFGMGTQRVEEEVERKFLSQHGIASGRTMLRADSDTMQKAEDYFDALERFAKGEVRVLLGTQMIAKGLDFPNVRLVGVISADTALDMPDFRASERTFQLISQVAGRAGRGGGVDGSGGGGGGGGVTQATSKGLVIVQTMNPSAPAVEFARRHDFVGFATAELALRERYSLPPTTRLARVVARDKNEQRAQDAAQGLFDMLAAAAAGTDVMLRGPMACALSRIDDHYRFAVELTAGTRGALQRVLASARAQGGLVSDSATAVDVDPVNVL